ncbi:hypothetical protein PPL_10250 [Heterostelium album PN500]|uniref:Phytanoyl-CoA dioxygenase n=1 Tax=Heterostelium pallidum (strain ATCC 26659 / Pp 5 / PN500) TaxID=670386 RepID=D3BQR4_HETP5|nr:hypothetical protein PPL_10250 [Heterostelium album PN500]EFA76484.1 hypothetical protein PPL_10250 [Heterostelium album PN500]|eukprot:XP_020428616.1 hypothetical protein PPL_10250 [Heterostelium album PN500]
MFKRKTSESELNLTLDNNPKTVINKNYNNYYKTIEKKSKIETKTINNKITNVLNTKQINKSLKKKKEDSESESDSDSDYEDSEDDDDDDDVKVSKSKSTTTTFNVGGKSKISYSTLEKSCNTLKDDWPQWRKDLYHKGWAVVPNVVPTDRCATYSSAFWDWMENFNTGVKRDDSSTWVNSNWPGNIHGIFQHYAFGQNQFVWDIRVEQPIIDVFTKIYNTDKLGSNKFGFRCVQGFLNLNHCQDNDGGLIVYEGSHLVHDKYFRETGIDSKGDWWKFDDDPIKLSYFKDCKKVKVNCNIGDIVLWDSRTIHYACAPTTPERCRMVVYVSYQPASLISDSDLKKKVKCFKEKRMTSHWASENIKMFPKNPRTYGNNAIIDRFKYDEKKLPVLTNRAKQLAGLIPYNNSFK